MRHVSLVQTSHMTVPNVKGAWSAPEGETGNNGWALVMSAAAAAKSLQSCLTLCNPIDGSPSGSPVPGILQGRTLDWVAISFSNAWKWKVKLKLLSRVRLLATPWIAAYQAPLSMGFSRQESYQSANLQMIKPQHSEVR